MSLTVTAAPTELPLSLDVVKSQLGITTSDEDARLEDLVLGARDLVEKYADVTLLTTAYLLALPGFSGSRGELDDFWFEPGAWGAERCSPLIKIPRPPLVSVQSVKYYTDAGVLTTIDAANYQVDARSRPGRLAPVYTYTWPTPGRRMDPVEIAYTAGFGATADTVPRDLRLALYKLVAHWNENREAFMPGALDHVPLGFDELLSPYKNGSL